MNSREQTPDITPFNNCSFSNHMTNLSVHQNLDSSSITQPANMQPIVQQYYNTANVSLQNHVNYSGHQILIKEEKPIFRSNIDNQPDVNHRKVKLSRSDRGNPESLSSSSSPSTGQPQNSQHAICMVRLYSFK